MKKNMRKSHISLYGYAVFFGLVALIITCAVLVSSALQKNIQNPAIIAGIMLIVVVVLSLFCTLCDLLRRRRMVDRPAAQIADATARITHGDFSVRLKPLHRYGRYDHYDYIMEDINKMAEELSRNEMLKADFISNVSHEIKTPLTVINNYATMLQAERIVQEERMAYAQAVLTAAQSLNGLVSNILKLNKLENQIIQEQKTQLRLGDYIGELVLGFENSLDEKNIEITCDLDDVVCLADKTLIAIICNNLLSNAVKFTPVGGKIAVSLKENEEHILLKVADTGIGMTPEIGARIFDKFYQGDTSHKAQGNGLGLALVKKVVDIIGGEIHVKSRVGEGSEFMVSLKK